MRARLSAAAIVAVLSLSVSAAASSPDSSSIRIDNFGRVDALYYRGGQPEGRDYADLAALGVKAIVNLTSDDAAADEPAMVRQAGLKYFQIPMTTHNPPSELQLAEFLKIVEDPANQPVFVHCVGGRHRTGVMTAVYRMTNDKWTADQAFNEMKQYKFGADFLHPEFKRFVYAYQSQATNVVASSAAPGAK